MNVLITGGQGSGGSFLAEYIIKNHPEYNNYPHFTYFVQNNVIVSSGINKSIVPDKKWGYRTAKDFLSKYHSELDCWRRCKEKPNNMFAINIRLNKKRETRMSAACSVCRKILKSIGISKCYFSIATKG